MRLAEKLDWKGFKNSIITALDNTGPKYNCTKVPVSKKKFKNTYACYVQ